jgi:translin
LGRSDELAALGGSVLGRLDEANAARETALAACRRTIQAASAAIRAVHRREWDQADERAGQAGAALRQAQEALAPYPALAAAGPLHDAAKEYAEARLTAALAADRPLPSPEDLGIGDAAWLNGLAEAASELRRHLLDRLREGDVGRGEELLAAMDDVYALLVTVDYPDALTGGLRRTTDALRAVLERTRGDLTTTLIQQRLRDALERRLPE